MSDPLAWTKRQASVQTTLSVSTINKYIKARSIPFYKKGTRVLFNSTELRKWLFNNPINPITPDIINLRRTTICPGKSGSGPRKSPSIVA